MRLLKKMLRHVGRRGVILIFFGLLWMSSGTSWAQSPPTDTRSYTVITEIVNFRALGYGMTVVGLLMIISSIFKVLEDISFGASAFFAGFLGVGVLATYFPGVPGPSESAPRVAAIYLTYALLVFVVSGWPEPPSPPDTKEKSSDGP